MFSSSHDDRLGVNTFEDPWTDIFDITDEPPVAGEVPADEASLCKKPPPQRILDTLARVLSVGPDDCVAVVFMDEKITIVANSLYATSGSDNARIRHITLVMNNVVNNQEISEDDFMSFCRFAVKSKHIVAIANLTQAADITLLEFAKIAFTSKGTHDIALQSLKKLDKQLVHNLTASSFILFVFCDLRQALSKLIRYTQFKEKKFEILRIGENGEHAEMKMLHFLQEKNKIKCIDYIGVSKLCCYQCASALNQAGIDAGKYRGTHGLSFGTSVKRSRSDGQTGPVSMVASDSGSEADSAVQERLGALVQKDIDAVDRYLRLNSVDMVNGYLNNLNILKEIVKYWDGGRISNDELDNIIIGKMDTSTDSFCTWLKEWTDDIRRTTDLADKTCLEAILQRVRTVLARPAPGIPLL
jgi:hypothetical protein